MAYVLLYCTFCYSRVFTLYFYTHKKKAKTKIAPLEKQQESYTFHTSGWHRLLPYLVSSHTTQLRCNLSVVYGVVMLTQ